MQWVITWWNQPITWTDADKILVKNNLRKPFELNLNDCMKDFSYITWLQIVFLTHCGLVTTYGDIDLGQHWLR